MSVILNIVTNGTIRNAVFVAFDAVPTVEGETPLVSGVVNWGIEEESLTNEEPCVAVPADPGLGLPDGSMSCTVTFDANDVVPDTIYFNCEATWSNATVDTSETLSIPLGPPIVESTPEPPTPSNIPIGAIAPQNDGSLGSQAFGVGSNLASPNFISPDKFIEDIDNFS